MELTRTYLDNMYLILQQLNKFSLEHVTERTTNETNSAKIATNTK